MQHKMTFRVRNGAVEFKAVRIKFRTKNKSTSKGAFEE